MFLFVFNSNFILVLHCMLVNVLFFFCFMHILKAILFSLSSSFYSKVFGIVIFILLSAISFLGYILPLGQMSFWGATVILNLLSVAPFYDNFYLYIFGDFSFNTVTVSRIFTLHFFLPFVLLFFVVVHLFFLHLNLSSNNLNLASLYFVYFFPTILMIDFFFFFIILFVIFFFFFLNSYYFYEKLNFNLMNNLVTPIHIVPEWYFLFFYCILKLFANKTVGVIFMILSFGFIFSLLFNNYYKF